MATNKISISFCEYYSDVYNYLKNKPNISNFICELVKTQMTDTNTKCQDLRSEIEKIIDDILKDKQLIIETQSENNTSTVKQNALTKDDISLIKELF
ncbi:hypothetical protein ACJDT4_11985 [Clostridium neuense]|uniref:Uncharacterized protein n=1 Tax=Clostridium neuense TaxID=1728934 RepID=A0ABW8TFP1_9CLOT